MGYKLTKEGRVYWGILECIKDKSDKELTEWFLLDDIKDDRLVKGIAQNTKMIRAFNRGEAEAFVQDMLDGLERLEQEGYIEDV